MIALVPSTIIALGIRTGTGLFQLREWARRAALAWASIAIVMCLALIALRPFQTFFIPDHFVSDLESRRQLVAISFLFLLFPVSVWWLFFLRTRGVKLQFDAADTESAEMEKACGSKT
jgi:hypothetical protein